MSPDGNIPDGNAPDGRRWSSFQVILAVVAVVVFAVVAVLGVIALDGGDDCTEGEQEVAAPMDRTPEEALAEFVAANESTYPHDGWEVDSVDDDVTVFTNDEGGAFTVEVESGVVRRFERCER